MGWLSGRGRATLSVCVVTQNQAGLLGPMLQQAAEVATEIVVVDGGSTDTTREVAEACAKVRVIDRPFDTIARQKNFAIEQAKGDWVLVLDSDELMGDRLVEAIPRLIRSRWRSWYKLPRYWLVEADPPRYVVSEKLYPDWQLRLFRNEPRFRYTEQNPVHHHFPRKGRGFGGRAAGAHIVHLDFLLHDRAARERKVARYDALDASAASTNRMYLFEDAPHEVRTCEEPIAALRGWSAPEAGERE